jgi:CHAT domain-containing protein
MRLLRLSCWSNADQHQVEIRVEAPGLAPRTASARFTFAVPPSDQELMRWLFETYREGPADAATERPARRAVRRLGELGGELFRAVFDASEDTRRLWAAVAPELGELRTEIATDVAGATALPWEIMTDPATGQPLCLRTAALVRAHPYAARTPELPRNDVPVRVLLVVSRPGPRDVPFWSVARHLALLQEGNSGVVQLDVLRPPTFAQLTRTLRDARNDGQPYQVVHFDGHGVWGDASDRRWLQTVIPAAEAGSTALWLASPARPGAHGYLLFENPRLGGHTQLVDGPALGNLLADAGVGLLVLNACRSAQADTHPGPVPGDLHAQVRAYGSLAHEAMDAGVAGVLAMRYNVFVSAAARFVADLYAGMVQGQSFGAAVHLARQNLAARPSADGGVAVPDWLVPVAYEAAPLHLISKSAEVGDHRAAARPDPRFHGHDDTLLALDRAFDNHSVVLLYGEADVGKTVTATEFGCWYRQTGGVPGPVIYTSLSDQATVAALATQLTAALAVPIAEANLVGARGVRVIRQIMGQVPLLWIWDDLGDPSPEWPELLSLVRAAPDTRTKLLLISRHDQRAELGDLPVRVHQPGALRRPTARHLLEVGGQGVGDEQPRQQLRLDQQRPEGQGDGDVMIGAVHDLDLVPGLDLARLDHPEVRAGPVGQREPLDPAGLRQPALERSARDPGAGRLQDQRRPDPPALADQRAVGIRALGGEVLAEHPVRQRQVQFVRPEVQILPGVGVYRHVRPAVVAHVVDPVPAQPDLAHALGPGRLDHDRARHGPLVDAGQLHRLPWVVPRLADVD